MKQLKLNYFIVLVIFILFSCGKDEAIPEEKPEEVTVEEESIIPTTTDGIKNVKQGCIEISTREVEIAIWDHGKIDNDIVSLYVNGVEKVHKITLDGPRNKHKFTATFPNNGYNYVTLKAHNLGDIPPNTAAISINGKKFVLRSNLKTNGAFDVVVTGYGVNCSNSSTNNSDTNNNNNSDNTNNSNSNKNGKISFYSKSDFNCGSINIKVNGYGSKTLNSYHSSGITNCNEQGTVTWNLPPGDYSYTANCSNKKWEGTFTVRKNGCLMYELKYNNGSNNNSGNNSGNTNNSNSNKNGKISFYSKSDFNCGSINIKVNGYGSKTLNSYHSSGITNCNEQGTVTWSLPPGNYSYTANCSNKKWEGTFTVRKNGCLMYELKYNNGSNNNSGNNSGNTNNSNSNKKGKISFYSKSDFNCGSINIKVNGYGSKTLNSYHPSGIANCNEQGVVSWNLPPGNYSYTANCSKRKWQGTFTIKQDGCLMYELQ